MTMIDTLIQQLKNENDYSGLAINRQQVAALGNLTRDEYGQVVRRLLEEPPKDSTGLRGSEYRKTYAHLVCGCLLAVLRPDPSLYPSLLTGALGIGDPSSIQYGAFALRQLKPIEQIAHDLCEISIKHPNDKELLFRIVSLLYWLGFSGDGHWKMPISFIPIKARFAPLLVDTALPEANEQEVAKMAKWASEIMAKS